MGASIPFVDKDGNEIVIFTRDVRKFEATAKDANGNKIQIDGFGLPKFGIKSSVLDTTFLVQGTGVIIDDGTDPLKGRFDMTIDFGAVGILGAFAASDRLITAEMEFTLVDGAGNDQTPRQYNIVINRDINTG